MVRTHLHLYNAHNSFNRFLSGAIFDHLFRQHQKACKQVNGPLLYLFLFTLYYTPPTHLIQNSIKKRIPIQPIDLSPGDLLYYGGVEWLNISDFLGKIKKVQILHNVAYTEGERRMK